MMNTVHNLVNPGLVAIHDAGHRIQIVVIREQVVHVLDAVGQLIAGNACIQESITQSAVLAGSCDNAVDVVQAVLQHSAAVVVLKAVVHSIVLLTITLVVALTALAFIQSRADDSVNHILLFLRQGIKYLLDGLLVGISHFAFSFLILVGFAGIIRMLQRFVLQRVIVRVQPMLQAQTRIGVNIGLGTVCFGAICAVLHNFIDQSAGVASSNYQAQFLDHAMHYGSACFLDAVCVDGHCINVAIVHASLGSLTAGRIVQLDVCIHAFLAVLQQCVPQHIVGAGMVMVPHNRNYLTVTFLKRIRRNSQAIKALHVGFGRPTGKVIIEIDCHFEFFTLLPADLHSRSPARQHKFLRPAWAFPRLPRQCYGLQAGRTSGPSTASYRLPVGTHSGS